MLKYIDKEHFRKIFKTNINDPSELEDFIEELNSNMFIKDSYKNDITKRLFLVSNENIPFSAIFSNSLNDSTFDLISDEFKNGKIPFMKYTLYDYIFKVYIGIKEDDFLSYENINNLEDEVKNILRLTDNNTSDLLGFVNILTETVGDETDTDYAEEFLSRIFFAEETDVARVLKNILHKELPLMVSTNRIFIYSALLNYSYAQIQNTEHFKQYLISLLNSFTLEISVNNQEVEYNGELYLLKTNYLEKKQDSNTKVSFSNNLVINYFGKDFKYSESTSKFQYKMENIPQNWDNIRKIFLEFLKELSKRTINY